jgi:hypothetical protein
MLFQKMANTASRGRTWFFKEKKFGKKRAHLAKAGSHINVFVYLNE